MLEAQIMKEQGLKQWQIAEKLGITDRTVRNYLKSVAAPRKKVIRHSLLDNYKHLVDSILEKDPHYNGALIYERLVKAGFQGKPTIMRAYLAEQRKKICSEAVIRFETEPGRQAQVDWKEVGKKIINGVAVKVFCFVMALGYSRKYFLKFTTSMSQSVLLASHHEAFKYFGGVPEEILYDNMKTAFICDSEGNWHANKRLLSFANHYGFNPLRCRVRRPQTKGKVERGIGYVQTNLVPRLGLESNSLEAFDEEAVRWLTHIDSLNLQELGESRNSRFTRETGYLKPLSTIPYDYRDVHELLVSRESFICFKTNRYSVPPQYIGQFVTLKVDVLKGEAEILSASTSIHTFQLIEGEKRKRVWLAFDKEKVMEMWLKKNAPKGLRDKTSLGPTENREAIDVEIRNPEAYDRLVTEVA